MTVFDQLKTQESRRKFIMAEQMNHCNHCHLTEWRGQPIALELEHKDGDSQNNARDNLECICPNCHSQTPTWRGRNKVGRKGITEDQMAAALTAHQSIYRALLSLKLAPKGGNYARAQRIAGERSITLSTTSGVKCSHAKLTVNDLKLIKDRREKGISYQAIADEIGVCRSTVRYAALGKTYKE